jgi:hypothetical protein
MKSTLYAFALACLLSLGAVQAEATPDPPFGRFLAPAPNRIVQSYYQTAPLTFDRPVFCSTPNGNFNCGTVRFDYATYLGNGGTFGGAVLSGGFYLNPMLKLARATVVPGCRLSQPPLPAAISGASLPPRPVLTTSPTQTERTPATHLPPWP